MSLENQQLLLYLVEGFWFRVNDDSFENIRKHIEVLNAVLLVQDISGNKFCWLDPSPKFLHQNLNGRQWRVAIPETK